MAARAQDIHAVAEDSLFEEGLFVLLMPDALFHDIFFYALCFLDVFAASLKDRVHLRAQANVFGNGRPAHSSFIFPSTFLLAALYSG